MVYLSLETDTTMVLDAMVAFEAAREARKDSGTILHARSTGVMEALRHRLACSNRLPSAKGGRKMRSRWPLVGENERRT